ncbi:MAG: flavin reductase [Clostridia bacterium]|nr:flavin reductase [Clostridia bacterium]
MSELKKIDLLQMEANPFDMIGKQWMLITAGDQQKYNTMTASWGGMGVLWNKNVVFIFIRPQRYTLEFVDESEFFTLCFFDDEYKNALKFCGTKSGRDFDKAHETGLTARFDMSVPYFEEAKLVLVCKKMYRQQLTENNVIDERVYKEYNNDYHYMFVGEIVEAYIK